MSTKTIEELEAEKNELYILIKKLTYQLGKALQWAIDEKNKNGETHHKMFEKRHCPKPKNWEEQITDEMMQTIKKAIQTYENKKEAGF